MSPIDLSAAFRSDFWHAPATARLKHPLPFSRWITRCRRRFGAAESSGRALPFQAAVADAREWLLKM
jgi:hypothetical protein